LDRSKLLILPLLSSLDHFRVILAQRRSLLMNFHIEGNIPIQSIDDAITSFNHRYQLVGSAKRQRFQAETHEK